jgi:hypothetical protein
MNTTHRPDLDLGGAHPTPGASPALVVRGSHARAEEARMGDATPPSAMGSTVSVTDQSLQTPTGEGPKRRSPRRWALPAAGAVLLLAGCAAVGITVLGGEDEPARPAPAAAGPSEAETQSAKDAAWQSVLTWNDRALQAEAKNSLEGIDLDSVAIPTAIQAEQRWIDSAIEGGTRTEGESQLALLSAEYNAAKPDGTAPATVGISACNDTSAVKYLDAAGNNVRVGPDGSTDYATKLVVNYWVYETDGAWKVDGGTRTETPC